MAISRRFRPPPIKLSVAAITAVLIGTAVGFGSFAFYYGKGLAYLSQDPKACANCHVMNAQFESWKKSPHHAVAVCNDCHTPAGTVAKYLTKAENGFWHSWAFTTERFHEPIQIREKNLAITQQACLKCHGGLFADITHTEHLNGIHQGDDTSCTHCHKNIGH